MIFNSYLNSLLIFSWIDIIEILFFSLLIYLCSNFLKTDKQKNLLFIFYLTLAIFIASSLLNVPTISAFFFAFWPVFLVFFFLTHQTTLQKNYISAKQVSIKNLTNTNWTEELVKACIQSINNNKQTIFILEGASSLKDFLNTKFEINSAVQQSLINFLINSNSYDQEKMIWITHTGLIKSINVDWDISNDVLWSASDNIHSWQKNSIIFTSKVDSIVFKTNPAKRTFDLVSQGKIVQDLPSNNILNVINQFVKRNELKSNKQYWNDNDSKKTYFDQTVS